MRNISINRNNITERMKNTEEISEILNKKYSQQKLQKAVRSNSIYIDSYKNLVEEIAELSYLNQDYLLFFRGQHNDFKPATLSSLYPSIYRSEFLSKDELQYRFTILEIASNMLKEEISLTPSNKTKPGINELKKIKKIQWSILQHYEVCKTPYLDLTHSLRVACSFAMNGNPNDYCYIYILGLPYLTGRISVNSEHDLVNIRLLSISPPQALRPFFQEGYMAGTEYVLDEYLEKSELDFNRRLIAVYRIPNDKVFWGREMASIEASLLFPENDRISAICEKIKAMSIYNGLRKVNKKSA